MLEELAENDPSLAKVIERIPIEIRSLLQSPKDYIGLSSEKAHSIVCEAKTAFNWP